MKGKSFKLSPHKFGEKKMENQLIMHLEANMNALEADYLALADKIQ